jgi:hypothetical protein
MTVGLVVAFALVSIAALALWQQRLLQKRETYIRSFAFPRGLFDKVIKQHPQLTRKDMELVSHGLRQFFLAYLKGRYQYVSMPSQLADDLWHEFILYTRNYQQFCQQGFGRFLHHTPAIVLGKNRQGNSGLRRCWRLVCREENINPLKPSRLPLLFALDAKFGIANGFRYMADCSGVRRADDKGGGTPFCGGDFSDNSIDGTTDGLSDGAGSGDGADAGGGDSGGCGGGCGGD